MKGFLRTARSNAGVDGVGSPASGFAIAAIAAIASTVGTGTGAIAATADAGRAPPRDLDCVLEPSLIADLGAAVPGLLAETLHDRSDAVSPGTLMARLESSVEEVSLALAGAAAADGSALALREANAAFGARTLSRNETLSKSDSISTQSLDQVRTETEIARLQVSQEREARVQSRLELERARALVERREIRSPIDGVVLERFKTTGEYVDNDPVYRVARLDPLHVEVIVPIDYLTTLATGMRADVSIAVPGFEGRRLEAEIDRIDAVADAASATYGVRLVMRNPGLGIPSGVRCLIDFRAD